METKEIFFNVFNKDSKKDLGIISLDYLLNLEFNHGVAWGSLDNHQEKQDYSHLEIKQLKQKQNDKTRIC